jgi:hypothetical protein
VSYASVVSLEEFRQNRSEAEFRQRLHGRFDEWLDGLEDRMKEPRPTLEQITHEIFAMR